MARVVKKTARSPAEVKVGEQTIYICRCGLSQNPQGLCDGSHQQTQDESEEKLYLYEGGERKEVKIVPVQQPESNTT